MGSGIRDGKKRRIRNPEKHPGSATLINTKLRIFCHRWFRLYMKQPKVVANLLEKNKYKTLQASKNLFVIL